MSSFIRCLVYYIAAIPFILFAIICAVFVIPMEAWKELKKKVEEYNDQRK